jgi:hypothetical protein
MEVVDNTAYENISSEMTRFVLGNFVSISPARGRYCDTKVADTTADGIDLVRRSGLFHDFAVSQWPNDDSETRESLILLQTKRGMPRILYISTKLYSQRESKVCETDKSDRSDNKTIL